MRADEQCFSDFALQKSRQNRQYFLNQPPDAAILDEFKNLAVQSIAKQKAIEANDHLSFDEFLSHYFAQR